MTEFINNAQQPSSLTSWRCCSSDGKIEQHGGFICNSFFPKASTLGQVQLELVQGGVNYPACLQDREREMGCAASFQSSVFHWDLIFFLLISWGDNGPLGEWKFSCPCCLCPSLQEPPPIQARQHFSSRIWTVVALKP